MIIIGWLTEHQTYQDYLESDWWIEKRDYLINIVGECEICKKKLYNEIFICPKFCPIRCVCNYPKEKCDCTSKFLMKNKLEVHHKTYDHIENEPRKDLIVVCKKCHKKLHKKKK